MVSIEALGVVLLNVYLICRYWRVFPSYAVLLLCIPIGIQSIYQWLRALRYYTRVRALYYGRPTEEITPDAHPDVALQTAIGGMTDVLSHSYTMVLLAQVLIWALLARLDGIK
jgi:hypothetical protein